MARKDISDLQVLQAYVEAQGARERHLSPTGGPIVWPEDVLQRVTGQPLKVCCAAMERAYDRGLIECGVSIRSGWITDAGRALLENK